MVSLHQNYSPSSHIGTDDWGDGIERKKLYPIACLRLILIATQSITWIKFLVFYTHSNNVPWCTFVKGTNKQSIVSKVIFLYIFQLYILYVNQHHKRWDNLPNLLSVIFYILCHLLPSVIYILLNIFLNIIQLTYNCVK